MYKFTQAQAGQKEGVKYPGLIDAHQFKVYLTSNAVDIHTYLTHRGKDSDVQKYLNSAKHRAELKINYMGNAHKYLTNEEQQECIDCCMKITDKYFQADMSFGIAVDLLFKRVHI